MWIRFVALSLILAYCHANIREARWAQDLAIEKKNKGNRRDQWKPNAKSHQKTTDDRTKRLVRETSAHKQNSNHVVTRWEQEVHGPVHKRLSTLADRICWDDGVSCEADTSCINCCAGIWSSTADGEVCGTKSESCLEDGTLCSDEYEYKCNDCCNPAFDNFGATCGGQCMEDGLVCDRNSTCYTCCSYNYYEVEDDTYQCGCLPEGSTCTYDDTCSSCCDYKYYIADDSSYKCGCKEDGVKCIPGEDCFSCCNGAYDDVGTTCGGTCTPNGAECKHGEDCHLCCSESTYWYSTGKIQCGYEPCYADGESCIPGKTCNRCCSGGAYDEDGICGGECLPSGSECSVYGTCNKCCPEYDWWLPSPPPSISQSPSMSPSSIPLNNYGDYPPYYYDSGYTSSYWNATAGSMVCGNEPCIVNGTACIPGETCSNCCSMAVYEGNGMICGGECLEADTKCEYHSTCDLCCDWRSFNTSLRSYVCESFGIY